MCVLVGKVQGKSMVRHEKHAENNKNNVECGHDIIYTIITV